MCIFSGVAESAAKQIAGTDYGLSRCKTEKDFRQSCAAMAPRASVTATSRVKKSALLAVKHFL
jgi:hypothetical protein